MKGLKDFVFTPLRIAGRFLVGSLGFLLMGAGLFVIDVAGFPVGGIPLFLVGLLLLIKALF